MKVFRCTEEGLYIKKDESKKSVMYILMEYVNGGELFEFLSQTGKFPENIARAYFL